MGPKAPNPYFYRSKFFHYEKRDLKFDFDGKTRRIFKQRVRPRAGPALVSLHALCVFSRRPLFDRHENPKK